jgi:hypothetical protein
MRRKLFSHVLHCEDLLTTYNGMQPVPILISHCLATSRMTLGVSAAPAVHRSNSSKQLPCLHSSATALMASSAAPRHGCHMRNKQCTWLPLVLSSNPHRAACSEANCLDARFRAAKRRSTCASIELDCNLDSIDCIARNSVSSHCAALPFDSECSSEVDAVAVRSNSATSSAERVTHFNFKRSLANAIACEQSMGVPLSATAAVSQCPHISSAASIGEMPKAFETRSMLASLKVGGRESVKSAMYVC